MGSQDTNAPQPPPEPMVVSKSRKKAASKGRQADSDGLAEDAGPQAAGGTAAKEAEQKEKARQLRAVAMLDVLERHGLTRSTPAKGKGGRSKRPVLSLHCRTKEGWSLLHLAAVNGWSETPLDNAHKFGNKSCVDVLMAHLEARRTAAAADLVREEEKARKKEERAARKREQKRLKRLAAEQAESAGDGETEEADDTQHQTEEVDDATEEAAAPSCPPDTHSDSVEPASSDAPSDQHHQQQHVLSQEPPADVRPPPFPPLPLSPAHGAPASHSFAAQRPSSSSSSFADPPASSTASTTPIDRPSTAQSSSRQDHFPPANVMAQLRAGLTDGIAKKESRPSLFPSTSGTTRGKKKDKKAAGGGAASAYQPGGADDVPGPSGVGSEMPSGPLSVPPGIPHTLEDKIDAMPSSSSSAPPPPARGAADDEDLDQQEAIAASLQSAADRWEVIKRDAISAHKQKKELEERLRAETAMAEASTSHEERLVEENDRLKTANPTLTDDELALQATADDVKHFQETINGRFNELQALVLSSSHRLVHLAQNTPDASSSSEEPAPDTHDGSCMRPYLPPEAPSPVGPPSAAAGESVQWLEELEGSELEIPERCVLASKRLEEIDQDIAKLVYEVGQAATDREASETRLQGLIEQHDELKRRDGERLTLDKLNTLRSLEDVMSFQDAALHESQGLKDLLSRSFDHQRRLESVDFQRDVERRIAAEREAREKEAAEQLKRQEEATAKKIADMQQQLDEERGKPKQSITSCVVCQEEPNVVALWPCRHKCLCTGCFENLKKTHTGRKMPCPICRTQCIKNQSGPVYDQGHCDDD
ncbi:unnamed protein product [Vitrella brassicaformis CCMP3155]|uniref:RING-type domain-containing protein n=1 Tax=Vitrella brassicaformis (strain CCMP3155) TaxID=1169540 RepID=A0A0G4GV46_VITBC|nr:unnamed protein product [Vitrella brassicaformis CCMP3155]|eukprot:CEM34768.1 unnamed protein product [Vitrella brassicaformis CCMP3155]